MHPLASLTLDQVIDGTHQDQPPRAFVDLHRQQGTVGMTGPLGGGVSPHRKHRDTGVMPVDGLQHGGAIFSRQAGVASGAAEAAPRSRQPAAVIDLSADAGDRAAEADARAAAARMQEQIKRDMLVQSVAAKSGAGASSSLLAPTDKAADSPLSQMSQRADEAYVAAAAIGSRAEGGASQGVDSRL